MLTPAHPTTSHRRQSTAYLHPSPAPRRPRIHLAALCLGVVLNLAGSGLGAQEAVGADDSDLRDLLVLLDNQTQLATKSGMNADFIPGMATVLSGDELLARGARTVWESLSLVPGFSQGLEATGERQILSRGVGFGYASGNIKILLDGVSMNSTLMATGNPVLNIPIEQVERIEVIRGPGSSVYGEYAYAGVINVITRRQGRTLHVQADQDAMAGAGLIWDWQDSGHELGLSVNVTGLNGDGGQVQVAEDALYHTGQPALSNAPGPVNDAHRYGGLFADLHWRSSFMTVKVLDDAYGDHFGVNLFLPPRTNGLASRQRNLAVEIGQDLRLSDTLSARIRLEGLGYERKRDHLYVFPAGYIADKPVYMNQQYREIRYLGAADIHWRPVPRHTLLFGLEASRIGIDQATWDWPALPFAIPSTWLDTNRKRRILSGIVQDEFRAGEHVTLTATLRYDDYRDVGSRLSPRLAAVWRIDDNNILKLQYAQAFRPPTFYELEYPGQAPLKSSSISTYELGYIRKQINWEGRMILFQSDLAHPLSFDYVGLNGYLNNPATRLRGIEWEYQQRWGTHIKFDANLSYVQALRTATGATLPGGTDLLGNLAILCRLPGGWTAALQLRYVGTRHRVEADPRPPLPGYTLLDLTLNWRRAVTGPFVYLGIKNLTDTEARYPDVPNRLGDVDLLYPGDYPQPGRRWWLSIGYAF